MSQFVLQGHFVLERLHFEFKWKPYLPEVFTDRICLHWLLFGLFGPHTRDRFLGWYLPTSVYLRSIGKTSLSLRETREKMIFCPVLADPNRVQAQSSFSAHS